MRVCLLSTELFGWGRYSEGGRVARLVGRELARRGVRVTAIVPHHRGQRDVEDVDGITVLSYPPAAPQRIAALCRQCDADVYHSQDPSLATAVGRAARPGRRHVVTIRAPRALHDWAGAFRAPPTGRAELLGTWARDANPLVWLAVHRAHAVCCAAEHLIPLARTRYRVREPELLPTPVIVPRRVQKGRAPMACYAGPWDRHARPEAFLALARRFPHVRFVAVGRPADREYHAWLCREYAHLPNVSLAGFVNPFRSDVLSQILSESWVLVTAATHRGLPDACVEGAAHRCAILSATDPGEFASRFGHHAADGDLAAGLEALLAGDAWRECGERGHAYVRETFELERAMDRHLAVYEDVLSR